MKMYFGFDELGELGEGAVVTVGNFDGVHVGHQAILGQGAALAQAERLPLVVMTFDPGPVKILRPDKAPSVITPLAVKLRLLDRYGADRVVVVRPDHKFLGLSPETFVKDVLVGRLRAQHVVEGHTFGFGQRREGTMVRLGDLAKRFGFTAHLAVSRTAELEEGESVAVSSTVVREYLKRGQFAAATVGLGHEFWLGGTVVSGHGRGRELGFPTANLKCYDEDQLVPADGVFAARARLGDGFDAAWESERYYAAAVSIGPCATFEDGEWQIEAYLLDAPEEELHGQDMLLTMVAKTREQERFLSRHALQEQMGKDCEVIRKVLGGE